MLALWAEGTDVAWALMDQAVSDHLVLSKKQSVSESSCEYSCYDKQVGACARTYLSLEALPAFTARTTFYWAIVRATLAVDVLVRADH